MAGQHGSDEADIRRLGKRELGRHAFEDRMPARVARLIAAEGDANTLTGVVDNLAVLLGNDPTVEAAYLCDASVAQVHKIRGEGHHFCGYRNIQMLGLSLATCRRTAAPQIPDSLGRKLPIPRIQDMIEDAWQSGINDHARVQTGGIRGTRKDIGTSEAEALLLSLNIPCTGHVFDGKAAARDLFDWVEAYFAPPSQTVTGPVTPAGTVTRTDLPPIFLQRPQHSVTIIGFERARSGKRRLLTFDPAFQPPSRMRRPMTAAQASRWPARTMLWRYRKTERLLRRYAAFETLTIDWE